MSTLSSLSDPIFTGYLSDESRMDVICARAVNLQAALASGRAVDIRGFIGEMRAIATNHDMRPDVRATAIEFGIRDTIGGLATAIMLGKLQAYIPDRKDTMADLCYVVSSASDKLAGLRTVAEEAKEFCAASFEKMKMPGTTSAMTPEVTLL